MASKMFKPNVPVKMPAPSRGPNPGEEVQKKMAGLSPAIKMPPPPPGTGGMGGDSDPLTRLQKLLKTPQVQPSKPLGSAPGLMPYPAPPAAGPGPRLMPEPPAPPAAGPGPMPYPAPPAAGPKGVEGLTVDPSARQSRVQPAISAIGELLKKPSAQMPAPPAAGPGPMPMPQMYKGGKVKQAKSMKSNSYAKGGSVSSASKRGDGCAQRGKTKGRIV